jgi:hypothetical protein
MGRNRGDRGKINSHYTHIHDIDSPGLVSSSNMEINLLVYVQLQRGTFLIIEKSEMSAWYRNKIWFVNFEYKPSEKGLPVCMLRIKCAYLP